MNTVSGGDGGSNSCGANDVSGGTGGAPSCPSFASRQPSGAPGLGLGAGAGGQGGQDSTGPIMGASCSQAVCCGLADFSVPSQFTGPQAGERGTDGQNGNAGRGCSDALGNFVGEIWTGVTATTGTSGTPGSGGGGGGAGGGTEMTFFTGQCEFADGLGGGGGGGGAGGCGGSAGTAGTSGGPSVALVIRYTGAGATLPTIEGVTLGPSDGGRGGDGGAGGDGGLGGVGALGGALPREDRNTPTLAGPFPGARGGTGGAGGAGGGAGGGCGGASVGVWVTGANPSGTGALTAQNEFELGRGGVAGRGGGGSAAAADGVAGGAIDVVVR
ncbi:MAG: hypothetical protein AAGF12_18725 [Myxococcota bacterium]